MSRKVRTDERWFQMMIGNGMSFGSAGFLWGIGGLLLIVGLVVLVVWAVSRQTSHDARPVEPPRSDALDLLRMRFARGEINEAEYAQAKSILGADR